MIIASDIYEKYESELKPILAKEKLMTGSVSLSNLVFNKAINSFKGKRFIYRDNLSIDSNDYRKNLSDLLKTDLNYLLEYDSSLGVIVDTNLKEVQYRHSSLFDSLRISGALSTRNLQVKVGHQLVKIDCFSSVSQCFVGVSHIDGIDYESNYVCINASKYIMRNSFNNQHYDCVYLSENNASEKYLDCFNNCIIDNLYIKDKVFSSHLDLESCFKFTKVGRIHTRVSNDVNSQHLLNRFDYMRGLKNV